MSSEQILRASIKQVLLELDIRLQKLPDVPLQLWLLSDQSPKFSLHDERLSRLFTDTPYWSFCWASGLAMAKLVLLHPELVAGKTVMDFGAGSGVVGIAAKLAGAKRVLCCDLDPVSLEACKANALVAEVELEYCLDLHAAEAVDLLLAADVLYDLQNRPLLDVFLTKAADSVVADSRVRDFKHGHFTHTGVLEACTWPDLDESAEFRAVNFYATKQVEHSWGAAVQAQT